LYAAGNSGFALQKMAFDMDEAAISDWALPLFGKSSGVLKGEALQSYVNKAVGNVPLEKLKIPFGVVPPTSPASRSCSSAVIPAWPCGPRRPCRACSSR
jgi:hypothetical protein